jgi:hypothetical protein
MGGWNTPPPFRTICPVQQAGLLFFRAASEPLGHTNCLYSRLVFSSLGWNTTPYLQLFCVFYFLVREWNTPPDLLLFCTAGSSSLPDGGEWNTSLDHTSCSVQQVGLLFLRVEHNPISSAVLCLLFLSAGVEHTTRYLAILYSWLVFSCWWGVEHITRSPAGSSSLPRGGEWYTPQVFSYSI